MPGLLSALLEQAENSTELELFLFQSRSSRVQSIEILEEYGEQKLQRQQRHVLDCEQHRHVGCLTQDLQKVMSNL